MRMKKLQDTGIHGIDNVFFLEKSCRKMYMIVFAVQCQQRKSDVMMSFGLTAPAAPSIITQVPHSSGLYGILANPSNAD
jgi:hypothetical protein